MLLRNTLLMGSTTIVRLVAGFFAFVLVARQLGVASFGAFVYWMTVASLVALAVSFGCGPYMLKELGARPEDRRKIVGSVGASRIALTLVAIICSLFATPLMDDHALLYWLFLAMAIADVFSEYVFCGFRATGDYLTEVWMSTLTAVLHFGLIYSAILLDFQLIQIAFVFALSRVATCSAALLLYRNRFGPLGLAEGRHEWLAILRRNRSYAADAFLTNLYTQSDTLILNHLGGPAALGIYQAGMRLMQGLNNVAPVLSNVYLPTLAREFSSGQPNRHTATLLYVQLVGFGLLVAIAFTAFPSLISATLFGEKYSSLASLLPWLGLLLMLRLFASHFGILLTASGQQSMRAWSNLVGLVVLLFAGVLLVPKFGALGMIWSALAATTVVAGTYLTRVMTGPANPSMNRTLLGAFAIVVSILSATILNLSGGVN